MCFQLFYLFLKASFFIPTQRDPIFFLISFFSHLRIKCIIRDKKSSTTQTLSRSSHRAFFSALPALSRSLSPFFLSIFYAIFRRNLTSTRRSQCRKRKYLYQRVAVSRYTVSFLTRAPAT